MEQCPCGEINTNLFEFSVQLWIVYDNPRLSFIPHTSTLQSVIAIHNSLHIEILENRTYWIFKTNLTTHTVYVHHCCWGPYWFILARCTGSLRNEYNVGSIPKYAQNRKLIHVRSSELEVLKHSLLIFLIDKINMYTSVDEILTSSPMWSIDPCSMGILMSSI